MHWSWARCCHLGLSVCFRPMLNPEVCTRKNIVVELNFTIATSGPWGILAHKWSALQNSCCRQHDFLHRALRGTNQRTLVAFSFFKTGLSVTEHIVVSLNMQEKKEVTAKVECFIDSTSPRQVKQAWYSAGTFSLVENKQGSSMSWWWYQRSSVTCSVLHFAKYCLYMYLSKACMFLPSCFNSPAALLCSSRRISEVLA